MRLLELELRHVVHASSIALHEKTLATIVQPERNCSKSIHGPYLGVNDTKHPFTNDIVPPNFSRGFPVSLASTFSNSWNILVVVYSICVSANCCPMQILGPPPNGIYSQLNGKISVSYEASWDHGHERRGKEDEGTFSEIHLRESQVFPPLRAELFGVLSIEILPSMHGVGYPPEGVALWYKDGIFALWSTADG